MFDLAVLRQRLEGYAVDDDPLTGASNRLALFLASSQPFYPLYVRWVTGETSPSLVLTFLSTPFFLASPWITKRLPGIGRLWLPAIGAINTFFCGFVFGDESGVKWFFVPCIVIAFLSCRKTERNAFLVYSAVFLGAFSILHGRYGEPLFQDQAQGALRLLNAYSATVLSVIATWTLGRASFRR